MTDFKLNNVENIDRLSVLNDNFDKIENELNENTLKRDGTRDLKGSLNANGNRIFNLPNPVDNKDVATVEYVLQTATGVDIISGVASVNGRTGAVGLTKTDVQLDNVDNTTDLNKPVSLATQARLDNKINVGEAVESVNGRAGDVQLTRADVNLSNVNNTTDMDKPVSTAQQAAITAVDDKVEAVNSKTGWGNYVHDNASQVIDDVYSPVVINGLAAETNTSYLPGTQQLWDTANNLITPYAVGDSYVVRVLFPITAKTSTPTLVSVAIDLSSDGTNIIAESAESVAKAVPFTTSFVIPIFTLETFIANGGRVLAKTDTGSVTIDGLAIFIQRIHSAVL